MFTPHEIRRVHLIGVGGTAMAQLAAMLQERGIAVTGSDEAVYPPMSDFLAQRHIPTRIGYGQENLDEDVDLVVIGNALSRGNAEVEAVLDRGVPYCSLPELLRDRFIQGKRALVVTGTHGKTTTASLLAWILFKTGREPSFMVGGIPRNFASGYRLGAGSEIVLEGDEYDTAFFDKRPKFLHYLPRIVTLGSLEFDHADIYRDMEELLKAFRWLLRIIPRSGRFIFHAGDPNARLLAQEAPCPVVSCALQGPPADWGAQEIRIEDGRVRFVVVHRQKPAGECHWQLPGRHNLLNALFALAAAEAVGVPPEDCLEALSSFEGVRRRAEFLGTYSGVLLYDDFAHHPTAIRSTLEALRALHPGRTIWAVFEPRSNTMCRRFFQETLADAFACADKILLGAVHRADRIPVLERLDIASVVQELRRMKKEAWGIPEVPKMVRLLKDEAAPGDLICIMSNGGFGGIQELLKKALGGDAA